MEIKKVGELRKLSGTELKDYIKEQIDLEKDSWVLWQIAQMVFHMTKEE